VKRSRHDETRAIRCRRMQLQAVASSETRFATLISLSLSLSLSLESERGVPPPPLPSNISRVSRHRLPRPLRSAESAAMTGTVIVSAPRAVTSAAFYDPRKTRREMFYDPWPLHAHGIYVAWIVPEKSPPTFR